MAAVSGFNLPKGEVEEEFEEEDEDGDEDNDEEGEEEEEDGSGTDEDEDEEGESDESEGEGESDDDEKPSRKKKYTDKVTHIAGIFRELEEAKEQAMTMSKQLRATPPSSPLFGGAPPPTTQFSTPFTKPLNPPNFPSKPQIVMVPGPPPSPGTARGPTFPPPIVSTPTRQPPQIVMTSGPTFPPPLAPATSLPSPSQSATTVLGLQVQGTPVRGTVLDPDLTLEAAKAKKSDEDDESHKIRSTLIDKLVAMGYRPGQAATFSSMIIEKAKTQVRYDQQMEELLVGIMNRL